MTQMLMAFETLDKDDVKEMIEGTWDIEKKRARLKVSENLQKKSPEPVKPKATPDMPEPQQA